jgi:hypothetical protein
MPEFKNFKFVSPGVQIKEIDNSQRPKQAEAIGPVVIGRARKGLAMQPVKVESYSDFIDMFGDTVAGSGGGDVYRDGNDMQSPMYGTYAAKAFLRSNVAPITYIRLLGQEDSAADTGAGQAGWKTDNAAGSNGGAIGLWVFPSGGMDAEGPTSFTGSNAGMLAAVWYMDDGTVKLSGSVYSTGSANSIVKSAGTLVNSNDQGEFTVEIAGTSTGRTDVVTFGFNDSNENFVRKKFNTNPQLRSAGDFYAVSSERDYWLGETFEQELRDLGRTSGNLVGLIAGIGLSGSATTIAPNLMKGQQTREACAGWFIGQDLGSAVTYNPLNNQKLFRVLGRGHGEWLQRNLKISIERIRQSTSDANPYGTFSVVLRRISDTDNAVEPVERFDGCTLDPTSPNFVARKVGTAYQQWDATEKRLKEYSGDHPNRSKYIRVEMNADVEAGAADSSLVPFGYYGPPKASNVVDITGSNGALGRGTHGTEASKFVLLGGTEVAGWFDEATFPAVISSSAGMAIRTDADAQALTCSLNFPSVRLRNSASDGGLSDPTRAYFGMQTTRAASATRNDLSIADFHRLPYAGFADDPVGSSITGFDSFSYIFSMDDVVNNLVATTGSNYCYVSGARSGSTSVSSTGSNTYKSLLDAGYDSFTAPFWGAFDGFDIRVPDPTYNTGIPTSPNDQNSSIYYTWKKAIDTVADPEAQNMNLLAAPGLTNNTLTQHMINVCESRADALAIIDLPNVYIPSHESYKSDKKDRVGTTPVNAANDLKSRGIDSSYGCTFYPWVQTTDSATGQLVWIPPSVAMMGVLASSERRSKLWFAPAGFNRGGLSDGAAGIPVLNVTERLTSKNRDTLYESHINPIASFPSSGIVVFGQKTLQQTPSALDRINVRRLVIYLKKQISIISNQIIFDQNVQSTWNRFKGLAEPFLANVLTQFGITNYSLILDETTTTEDLIDQNILYAKIAIQPARAIEYIAIDFVITNTGASFED